MLNVFTKLLRKCTFSSILTVVYFDDAQACNSELETVDMHISNCDSVKLSIGARKRDLYQW